MALSICSLYESRGKGNIISTDCKTANRNLLFSASKPILKKIGTRKLFHRSKFFHIHQILVMQLEKNKG